MGEFYELRTDRELCPASIYDVAANETWLEDKAREGWRLTGFRGVSGIFAREEPRECRYRLKPMLKKEKAPDPEWVEMYRDLGWEYAATIRDLYHVWRSDDPAAPELDTDPVVQGEGFGYLWRRLLRGAIAELLLLLALVGLLAWSWLFAEEPLRRQLEGDFPLRTLRCCLLVIMSVALEYRDLRSMRRLLHTLKLGSSPERPSPYRRSKWWNRAALTLLVIYWIANMAGALFIGHTYPVYAWPAGNRADGPDSGVVYVDLRELDGVPEDSVSYEDIKTKLHELAPRMYWTRQYAELPDGTDLMAVTSYYHLLTPLLTPQMERDLLARQTRFEDEVPMEQIDGDALDGLWWRQLPNGHQYVVASLGRNVLYLLYDGPTDLRTAGDYLAELLEAGA